MLCRAREEQQNVWWTGGLPQDPEHQDLRLYSPVSSACFVPGQLGNEGSGAASMHSKHRPSKRPAKFPSMHHACQPQHCHQSSRARQLRSKTTQTHESQHTAAALPAARGHSHGCCTLCRARCVLLCCTGGAVEVGFDLVQVLVTDRLCAVFLLVGLLLRLEPGLLDRFLEVLFPAPPFSSSAVLLQQQGQGAAWPGPSSHHHSSERGHSKLLTPSPVTPHSFTASGRPRSKQVVAARQSITSSGNTTSKQVAACSTGGNTASKQATRPPNRWQRA